MTERHNAKPVINTGGQLKYIWQFDIITYDCGFLIDLSGVEFEQRTGETNAVKIFNTGLEAIYVRFDNAFK